MLGGSNVTLSADTAAGVIWVQGATVPAVTYQTQSSSWLGGVTATAGGTSTGGPVPNTLYFSPFFCEDALAFNVIKLPFFGVTTASTTAVASSASSASSSLALGIFSQAGTNLTLMSSTSMSLSLTWVGASVTLTYPGTTGNSTSLASSTLSTTNIATFSGAFALFFPFQATLASGLYWIGALSGSAGMARGVRLFSIYEPKGGYIDGKNPNISLSGGAMTVSTAAMPVSVATSAIGTASSLMSFDQVALAHNFGV
jgi:hypothetical protein